MTCDRKWCNLKWKVLPAEVQWRCKGGLKGNPVIKDLQDLQALIFKGSKPGNLVHSSDLHHICFHFHEIYTTTMMLWPYLSEVMPFWELPLYWFFVSTGITSTYPPDSFGITPAWMAARQILEFCNMFKYTLKKAVDYQACINVDFSELSQRALDWCNHIHPSSILFRWHEFDCDEDSSWDNTT